MIQYSKSILNKFGAPELSDLTECGARELGPFPDHLLASALWNHICGLSYPNLSVQHFELTLLRRAYAAVREYNAARSFLVRFIVSWSERKHNLGAILHALTHFEQCIGQVWQAASVFNRIEHSILKTGVTSVTL